MTHITHDKVLKAVDVSDFRAGLAAQLKKAKKKPVVITARRGGDSYVVLSVEAYNKLVEAWEDEQDSKELARLVRTASKNRKSWTALRDLK